MVGIASNYNYTEGNINRNLAIAISVKSLIKFNSQLSKNDVGLKEIEKVREYIDSLKNDAESSDESKDLRGRTLHEYYVEQDAFFIPNKGSEDWMSPDEDIKIHRKEDGKREGIRKIIEDELMNQSIFSIS